VQLGTIGGVIAGRPAPGTLAGALRADKSPRARRKQAAGAGGHGLESEPPQSWRERHATALWIGAGVLFTLLLRAPWLDAALGRDEAGLAMIARHFHTHGAFAYGDYFLDRPPLLVGLYAIAATHGAIGIRALGALASASLVVTTTLLAVRLAGRAAAPWAAAIAAVLASSVALNSVYTPAELLAVVPSCASVLLLVTALERQSRRLWLLAGAGALGATALLVKQSFGDALVAGGIALAAGKVLGVSWRETLRRTAAYAAGVGSLFVALVVWAQLAGTPSGSPGSVYYAILGFRLDAVNALANDHPGAKLLGLAPAAITSGLVLSLLLAGVGIVWLRDRGIVPIVLAGWLLAAAVGVVLGGSYWTHYLIALVPGAAAGAAVVLARRWRVGTVALGLMVVPAVVTALASTTSDSADGIQHGSVAIGHYLHVRAEPHQTAYVLYAKVNALYYSGLPSPFPYHWSLMMRAVPGVEGKLRALLASSARPTWVVEAQRPRSFGLDRSGATQRLLVLHYRRVATFCGARVLLARGAHARPGPAVSRHCARVPA
jgi:hypothetical protein